VPEKVPEKSVGKEAERGWKRTAEVEGQDVEMTLQ